MLSKLLLAFVVGTTFGTESSPEASPSLAVHVRIDQAGRVSAQDLRSIIEEVRRIWAPVGLDVTSGGYADPVPTGRAVVSLRLVPEQWIKKGRHVLGWVVPPGELQQLPTVFISRSAVRGLLARATLRGKVLTLYPPGMLDRMTVQAIGRVAAHELGHYLLRSRDHTDDGLMRPVYTTTDLLAPSVRPFQIQPSDWPAARYEVGRLAESQTRQGLEGR